METKVEYIIELIKKGFGGKEAKDELDQVDKAAKNTGKSLSDMGRDAKAAFAAIGGAALLRDAINEFIEGEQAINRMNGALRAQGRFSRETSEEMRGLARALSEVTTFTTTQVTNVIAKLIAFGATKDQIKPLTQTVLDVSTLMERDLPRATVAVGQALRGNFEAFQQLGIEVDKTKSSGEQWVELMDKLARVTGGQATEAMKGFSGQILEAKKNIAEMKEELGKLLAGGFNQFNTFLGSSMTGALSKPAQEDDIRQRTELYKGLADAIARTVQERLRLDQIDNGEANRIMRDVNAARKVLGDGLPGDLHNYTPEELARRQEELNRVKGLLDAASGRKTITTPATSPAPTGIPAPAETAEQRRARGEALFEEGFAIDDAEREEALRKEREITRVAMERHEQNRAVMEAERDMQNQIAEGQLRGIELEMFQSEAAHEKRIDALQQLKFEDEDRYNRLIELENQLYAVEQERIRKSHDANERFKVQMREVGRVAQESFAGGLAGAIVDAFEEGDRAFEKFAANFMKQIAQMILQALILRAIQSGLGAMGFGGGGAKAANGGFFIAAASGVQGVESIDSPTYFPRFNVLAGEAGREVMTVLANPRLANINGAMAQIGSVNGRQMAIVPATALAKGGSVGGDFTGGNGGNGGGGKVEIEIHLAPGLVESIKSEATEQATVRVVRDMQQDTPLSAATKRLVS